jgi:hypothetical protein
MDEYMVEINDLRRRIGRLKFEHGSLQIIEELEAQLRILRAIYGSATNLFAAGESNPRLQAGLRDQQFGSWTFEDVYAYVYEEAVALSPQGQDLATVIWHHDYTTPLLNPLATK